MSDSDKIKQALEIIFESGQVDGAHHKAWVIDQVTRILADDKYALFVSNYKLDVDTGDEYEWDEGIAP